MWDQWDRLTARTPTVTPESTFQQPIRRHVRRFTVSRTPPFRSVSLITEQLARRPPRRAALGALLSHVAPHGIGTPLARRTSWHLGNQLGRLKSRNLAPGVVDFRSSLRSSRARSGRVGHHVGFVSRPSQPWILHRRENIRETRELQIAASRDAGRASPREAAPIENGGTCKATSPHHSCQMPQLVLASLAPVDPSDTKMDPVKPAARGKGNQRVAGTSS